MSLCFQAEFKLYRAANEAAWAAFLGALGEPYRYEALEPDLSRAIRYRPDFWLPKRLAWVEIKTALPTEGEWQAARILQAVPCLQVSRCYRAFSTTEL